MRNRRRKTVKTKSRATSLKVVSTLLFINAAILFPFLLTKVQGTVTFWDIAATINISLNPFLIIMLCVLGALHSAHRQAMKDNRVSTDTHAKVITKKQLNANQ